MYKKLCPTVQIELNEDYREDFGPEFFQIHWDSDPYYCNELDVERIDSGFQVFFKFTQWTVLHTRILWHRDDKAEGRVQVTIVEVDKDEASIEVRPKMSLAGKGGERAEIKSLGTAKIKIENFSSWLEKQLNEAIHRKYVEWFGEEGDSDEPRLGDKVRVYAIAHSPGQPDVLLNGEECEIVGIGPEDLLVSFQGNHIAVDSEQCFSLDRPIPDRKFKPGDQVAFFLNPFVDQQDDAHDGVVIAAATVVRQEGQAVTIRLEDSEENDLLPSSLLVLEQTLASVPNAKG